MKSYIRADYVGPEQIDYYLANGWEIIDTTKEAFEYEQTNLKYHVGFPARLLIEQMREIIKDYERFGLKEVLFKKIAEENGEDVTKYSSSGKTTNDKTPKYMEKYYKVIHNQNKHFYEEYTQEEIEEKFIF